MKKCGRIYYEMTEEEREELSDLVNEIYDYHRNFDIHHMNETFERLFEIIDGFEE